MGKFQRQTGDVSGHDFCIVDVFCDGDCNAAGASAYVRDGAALRCGPEPFDGTFHQQFCFRTRNQHIGSDLKIKAEKLPVTEHVGERFSCFQPGDGFFNGGKLRTGQKRFGMSLDPGARFVQDVCE